MSVGSRIESKMKKNYTSNVEFFFCLAELKYTTNKFALRSVTVGSLFVRKFQHDEDTTCVSRYYWWYCPAWTIACSCMLEVSTPNHHRLLVWFYLLFTATTHSVGSTFLLVLWKLHDKFDASALVKHFCIICFLKHEIFLFCQKQYPPSTHPFVLHAQSFEQFSKTNRPHLRYGCL